MKTFIAFLSLAMMALRLTISGRPPSPEWPAWFMSVADIIAAYWAVLAFNDLHPYMRKTELFGPALAAVAYFGGRLYLTPFFMTWPGAFELASHIASGLIIFEMFHGTYRLWSMLWLIAAFSFEFAMFKINQASGFM